MVKRSCYIVMLIPLLVSLTYAREANVYRFKEFIEVKPQPKAKLVELWIPLPRNDSFQEVRDLKISSPLPFTINTDDEYGNSYLYIKHKGSLNKTLKVKVEARIVRKEVSPKTWGKEIPIRYLLRDRLIPLSVFAEMAKQITQGKEGSLTKLRAIYDYVVSHLKYDKSGKGWGRGDAIWACSTKRGNCTDFHSLFIALARVSGIPSIFEIGIPIPKRGGKIKGYHCWVLAFPGGKIYGIDASEAAKHPEKKEYFFGHLSPNRISLTRGRDLLLSPAQHGERINFLYKAYLEVDLTPHPKSVKTVYEVYPE